MIAGPASFTLFPTLGVRVADVTLSAPPDMGGEAFLTAQSFDVGVRLLPLLRKEIVVDRLVLHEPVFDLRVDADGRRSWKHGVAQAATPMQFGASRRDAAVLKAGCGGESPARAARHLRAVARRHPHRRRHRPLQRRADGEAAYASRRSTPSAESRVHRAPLNAKGSFVWSAEKVDFDGTLTSPEDLLQQQPAKLALNVAGQPVTLSYDGSLTLARPRARRRGQRQRALAASAGAVARH